MYSPTSWSVSGLARIGVVPSPAFERIESAVRYRPAGQPSVLRLIDDDFLGGQIDAGREEDRARIVIAELEIARIDQGPAPAGKDPGDRQATRRPAGEHELRATVKVARERNEHVGRIRLGEAIDIVEDQDKRGRLCRESGAEARHGHRPDRGTGRGQGFGDIGPERGGPAEREGDVGEQDGRIVVALVDRQPGEVPRIALGPLREEGRLPVSGRRHNGDDRHLAARREPVDEGVSSQQAGARRWRDELRLENREAAGKQTDFSSGRSCALRAGGRHRRVSERSADRSTERRGGTGSDSENLKGRQISHASSGAHPPGSRSMAPPLRRGHGARGTGGTDALRILLHERAEATPEAFHPIRAMRLQ